MFREEEIAKFSPDELRDMRVILVPCCGRCSNIDVSFVDSCRTTNQLIEQRSDVDGNCPYMKFSELLEIYLKKQLYERKK
jgi:hypothetical protein